MEYIKTTISILVLLVAILTFTDVLSIGASMRSLHVIGGLLCIIGIIELWKEDPINRVKENAEVEKSPEKKKKPTLCEKIRLVIGLVIILMGAYMSSTFGFIADIVAPIFGGHPIETEIIDKVGYPIEAKDTYKGVTISADKIIGDRYNACVIFTVAKEDGTPIVLPEGVLAEDLFYGGECCGAEFPHKKREGEIPRMSTKVVECDGKLQIIEMFGTDDPFPKGKDVYACFDNLSYFGDKEDESTSIFEIGTPVLKGNWRLRYELDYEDAEITIPVEEQFIRDNLTYTVKDVTLSPIAIQANYTVSAVPQWVNKESSKQNNKEWDRFSDNIELLVTKKDGTVFDLTEGSSSFSYETKGIALGSKGDLFEEIVPIEDIVSVSVGDVEIPMNKQVRRRRSYTEV